MAINHERTTTIAFKLNNSIRKISSYNKFLQMMLRRFFVRSNKSCDLQSKSVDCFIHDRNIDRKRLKGKI